MFASYMETVSAGAEVSEPTDGGTKNAPESRVEPNLRRVKLNIGHLIIWGFTSGIISFLAGSKARNIIPNELKPRLIPRAHARGIASTKSVDAMLTVCADGFHRSMKFAWH